MKRTLGAAAQLLGAHLIGEDRSYGAVSTDSRTLSPGDLFVALHGPNFDGTEFVPAAGAFVIYLAVVVLLLWRPQGVFARG